MANETDQGGEGGNEMTLTVDEIMALRPCVEYPRERVEELFAGRERLSALDILGLDIPAQDRLWAVLRPELIPEPMLHEIACRFAEATLTREREAGREPDPRSWAAIEAKRKWLRGEITGDELTVARSAAWAGAHAARDAAQAAAHAARGAARSAAQAGAHAARSAAWAGAHAARDAAQAGAHAARDAAQAGARGAAWAARFAARFAARDARAEQVAIVRSMLTPTGGEEERE